MKFPILVRKLHKWVGLVVGIQILLWVTGGVVMSVFDIEEVRGNHNRAKQESVPLADSRVTYGAQDLLRDLARAGHSTDELRLLQWQGQPVWRVEANGREALISATSGERLTPLGKEDAMALARLDFSGPGEIRKVTLIETPLSEIRGRDLPLWQVQMADPENTRIYVSPDNGRVVSRRNDTWRLYDFFWMLHIMDYQERKDFNNPLLVTAAGVAWVMAFTGMALLIWVLFTRDLPSWRRRRKASQAASQA